MDGVVTLEDFTVEPEWESEFVQAWKECALHARQAPGRGPIWWLLRDGDRAGHYVGVSEWDSSDGLECWRRVPRYPEVVNQLRGLGNVVSRGTLELVVEG
jgi:heme-degrading monooxygenase HmoA